MKKLMLGLMMAFAATVARAEVISGVEIGGLKYDLDTDAKTASMTGYTVEPMKIDVDEVKYSDETYTVTTVKEIAFLCCPLTSLSLPNVTTIANGAFRNCASLTSVSLPKVTSIGSYAFGSCPLTSLSLPNAMTIAGDAFSDCTSLTNAVLPRVATVGGMAFWGCSSLTDVLLASATAMEGSVFKYCDSLTLLIVNPDMKLLIDAAGREYYGIPESTSIKVVLPQDVVKNAVYKMSLKSGDRVYDEDLYRVSCEYYGLAPKTAPQVVNEGEIAVTKESIAAAKAMTVQIVNGQVALGVSVCSNADITASSVNWAPVKFTKDTQIGLSADGTKLILPIPVAAQQGFMILQSGDAKVSEGGARVPVTGEPWYKPTVED